MDSVALFVLRSKSVPDIVGFRMCVLSLFSFSKSKK
jgi:hypothetical protein